MKMQKQGPWWDYAHVRGGKKTKKIKNINKENKIVDAQPTEYYAKPKPKKL